MGSGHQSRALEQRIVASDATDAGTTPGNGRNLALTAILLLATTALALRWAKRTR